MMMLLGYLMVVTLWVLLFVVTAPKKKREDPQYLDAARIIQELVKKQKV